MLRMFGELFQKSFDIQNDAESSCYYFPPIGLLISHTWIWIISFIFSVSDILGHRVPWVSLVKSDPCIYGCSLRFHIASMHFLFLFAVFQKGDGQGGFPKPATKEAKYKNKTMKQNKVRFTGGFSNKEMRLRQRSSTNSMFSHQQKAPAATFQD